MTEQELADLFAEQVDRLLRGQAFNLPDGADELSPLLGLGQQLVQVRFQPGPAAQAAFENQLADWFGPGGGAPPPAASNPINPWLWGLLALLIGLALLLTGWIIGVGIWLVNPAITAQTPAAVAVTPTPTVQPTLTAEPISTATVARLSDTIVITPTATRPIRSETVFVAEKVQTDTLCRGVYRAQARLVNRGLASTPPLELTWQVITGTAWIDSVRLTPSGPLNLAAGADLTVEIEAAVGPGWWSQPNSSRIELEVEVKAKGSALEQAKTTLTLVKQAGQWVTLDGYAYYQNQQTLLVHGDTVLLEDCTLQPPNLPDGSNVRIIAAPQPDGRFVAVKVEIISGSNNSTQDLSRNGSVGGSNSSPENAGGGSSSPANAGGNSGGGSNTGGDDDDGDDDGVDDN